MNRITLNRFLVFVLLVLFRTSADAAVLKNRYTFHVDANDQVGTAHGTLLGTALIQDGALVLSGTNASMQLPGNLLTNYTSLTLEIWYADTPVNLTNAQLFYFSGVNGQLYYSISGGAYFRAASSSTTTKPSIPSVALGGTNHLIWSLDGNSHTAKLYVNGVLVDSNMNCTNNPTMMGAIITSRIGGINGSYFRGRILEFRVYEGAVSDLDAACLEALGPDRLPVDPRVLEGLHIPEIGIYATNTIFGIHVLVDFAGMTNVDISTQPEMTLYSDDTNVAVITAEQKLKTIGAGTAKITAAYLGLSNSISFTVGTPRDFYLAHRYSFNEVTNDWILHDSVGSANGVIIYGSIFQPNAAFTGNGELRVSGGYASLPAGIVSSLDEVTIEAWFVWQTNIYRWQRIFDFGNSEVGTYIYATPASGDSNVVQVSIAKTGVGAETRLRSGEPIALNTNSFVAWVYSPVRRLSRLYVNGAPVASFEGKYAMTPLSSIIDTNNWLGRSQYSWDGPFFGRYNEFRIFRGALSDSEIQAEFAAGPDVIGADYVLRCQQDGDSIRISWGSSTGTSVLESSSTLDPTAQWNQVLQTPILANGRCSVTIPLSPDSTFFRLRNP